jgi:hypothetical protein
MDSILDLLRQLPAYEAKIEAWHSEKIEMVDHRQFLMDKPVMPVQGVYGNIPHETHQPGMMRWFGATGVVDIPIAWLEGQIYPFFDRVCDAYLTTGAKIRAGVRQAFLMHESVLLILGGYIGYASRQIQSENDVHWLQRGLAGAAICDSVQLGTKALVGELYVKAHQAQIDPAPYFEAAVKLCSAEPSKYGVENANMREFMAGFKDSAFFRNEIAPKL